MLSLQPHPPPTLICHGLYGGILQVSPVAYSYLVAKYQMSSGPYGPIFLFLSQAMQITLLTASVAESVTNWIKKNFRTYATFSPTPQM